MTSKEYTVCGKMSGRFAFLGTFDASQFEAVSTRSGNERSAERTRAALTLSARVAEVGDAGHATAVEGHWCGCYPAEYARPGHFRAGNGARRAAGTLAPTAGSVAGGERSHRTAARSACAVARPCDAAALGSGVRFPDANPARSGSKRDAAANPRDGAPDRCTDWQGASRGGAPVGLGVADARATGGQRHARRDAIPRIRDDAAGKRRAGLRTCAADHGTAAGGRARIRADDAGRDYRAAIHAAGGQPGGGGGGQYAEPGIVASLPEATGAGTRPTADTDGPEQRAGDQPRIAGTFPGDRCNAAACSSPRLHEPGTAGTDDRAAEDLRAGFSGASRISEARDDDSAGLFSGGAGHRPGADAGGAGSRAGRISKRNCAAASRGGIADDLLHPADEPRASVWHAELGEPQHGGIQRGGYRVCTAGCGADR